MLSAGQKRVSDEGFISHFIIQRVTSTKQEGKILKCKSSEKEGENVKVSYSKQAYSQRKL